MSTSTRQVQRVTQQHPTKRALRSSHSQRSTRSPSPFSPNTSHNEMPVASAAGQIIKPGGAPRRRSSRLSKTLKPNGSLGTPSEDISEVETVIERIVAPTVVEKPSVPLEPVTFQVVVSPPVVEVAIAPKIDWEIPRKVFHSSIGVAVVGLYISNFSIPPILITLFISLVFISIVEFIRLRHPRFEALFEKNVGFLMRESEKHKINGTVWYLIGVIFVLSVYPTDIGIVSILTLSWADTAASTIGRMWGRYTRPLPRRIPYIGLKFAPRKSTAGYAAAFFTGGVVTSAFLGIHAARSRDAIVHADGTVMNQSWDWSQRVGGHWPGLIVLGLWSGFVTAVSEALGNLDDNLTLPVLSGAGIWAYIALLRVIDSRLSKSLV